MIENNIVRKVRWSYQTKVITISCLLLFVVSEYVLVDYFIKNGLDFIIIAGIITLPVIIIVSILYTPRKIIRTDSAIYIKRIIGDVFIELDLIEDIQIYNPDKSELKIFGSGGFFGYLGKYKNSKYGNYYSYVCNYDEAVIIQTHNGDKYVFSCERYQEVVKEIILKIKDANN